MPIGLEAGRLLMTAAVTVQKCAVLPLSAMAIVSAGGIIFGGGGPIGLTVDKLKPESLKTLGGMTVRSRVVDIGSPRRQLVDADVLSWRGRPEEIVLLPPCMRNAVALSLCPSALFKQVREV